MAITALYENSASISTTEYSLPNNSTTLTPKTDDGVFQVFINLTNMIAGDQYEIKFYEKVLAAGAQVLVATHVFTGAQAKPGFSAPSFIFMHGWDVTVKLITGSARTIEWSIRQVA